MVTEKLSSIVFLLSGGGCGARALPQHLLGDGGLQHDAADVVADVAEVLQLGHSVKSPHHLSLQPPGSFLPSIKLARRLL